MTSTNGRTKKSKLTTAEVLRVTEWIRRHYADPDDQGKLALRCTYTDVAQMAASQLGIRISGQSIGHIVRQGEEAGYWTVDRPTRKPPSTSRISELEKRFDELEKVVAQILTSISGGSA